MFERIKQDFIKTTLKNTPNADGLTNDGCCCRLGNLFLQPDCINKVCYIHFSKKEEENA